MRTKTARVGPAALVAVVVVHMGLSPAAIEAREVLTIGAEGQISWEGDVTGADVTTIEPEFRSLVDPNETEVGTSPSGLIEFERGDRPSWILPAQLAEGQNVAPGLLDRGGRVRAPTVLDISDATLDGILASMIGESPTGLALARDEARAQGTLIEVDLGARFGVNRVRLFPRNTVFSSPSTPFQSRFLRNFELQINDGVDLTDAGNPIWEVYEDRRNNTQAITDVLVEPPRYIRFLRIKVTSSIPFEIEKVQVFGEGYIPTARYLSPIIDMGAPANWGQLRWSQETIGDAGASGVQIRTRTGTDTTPFTYTRLEVGRQDAEEIPLSLENPDEQMERDEYLDLPRRGGARDAWQRGSVRDDLVHWSPWSAPYDPEEATSDLGTAVLSPGPRRYIQIRADFSSVALPAATALERLSFDFVSPPLADSLVAEVFPREVDPSVDVPFVFAVRAQMASADLQGFDGFRVTTQQRVKRVERIEILDREGGTVVDHTFAVQDAPTDEGQVGITEVTEQGFQVRFPRIVEDGSVLKLHFIGRVLAYSTTFSGRAVLIEDDGFQGVRSGNALSFGEGDSPRRSGVTVLSPSVTRGGLVRGFAVDPAVTPNGDGINDGAAVSYEMVAVVGQAKVRVEVVDLAGRRVRQLFDGVGENGPFDPDRYPELMWDGTDDDKGLVSPGIYLISLEVEGDAQRSRHVLPVAVAY